MSRLIPDLLETAKKDLAIAETYIKLIYKIYFITSRCDKTLYKKRKEELKESD
jgi:hypothetical protein